MKFLGLTYKDMKNTIKKNSFWYLFQVLWKSLCFKTKNNWLGFIEWIYFKIIDIELKKHSIKLKEEPDCIFNGGSNYRVKGIYNPVEIVMLLLRKQFVRFNKDETSVLHIFEVKVDTQKIAEEDTIYIEISLARPGLFIGKAGSEVSKFKKDIKDLFQVKEVEIKINEIRDNNKPFNPQIINNF